MPIDANTVAAAVTRAQEYVGQVSDRGWVARDQGVFAWRTGIRLPTLNGVLVEQRDRVEDQVVLSLLDRVAEGGLPFCLEARPGAGAAVEKLAEARQMVAELAIPLLALENPAQLQEARQTGGLEIRLAKREDIPRLVTVGAAGFGAPEELFRDLMMGALFDLDGVRGYLGYRDDGPVTTALGVTTGDCVAIFNVATLPAYRRRGFGAAITASAVLDGLQAGARWAWLQSSSAGHNVYRRLGFRDIEEWACWVSPT